MPADKPEANVSRWNPAAVIPGFVPMSQRAPYTTAQICLLFGRSDGKGRIVPLHPNTVARWRRKKRIPFYMVTSRHFRYPRDQVDAILRARQESEDDDDPWHT